MIRLGGDPAGWSAGPAAVAIGVFDGVHLGHRAVLGEVVGSGVAAAVLTFAQHPAALLRPEEPVKLLTTLDDRLDLLAGAGITTAAVVDFDDAFRSLTPQRFAERYLRDGLGATLVAVGAGFRFGRGASGTVETLRRLGGEAGFTVVEVGPVVHDGVEVRSSTIRSLLAAGDVTAAAGLLGRRHSVPGVVVRGEGRGRTIGVPTANVAVPLEIALPAHGVYAVTAALDGAVVPGVANLGVRPTFTASAPTLEVHLFDFDDDIYGAPIAVSFVARIRDERRFESIEALVAQIGRDVAEGRSLLGQGS